MKKKVFVAVALLIILLTGCEEKQASVENTSGVHTFSLPIPKVFIPGFFLSNDEEIK